MIRNTYVVLKNQIEIFKKDCNEFELTGQMECEMKTNKMKRGTHVELHLTAWIVCR